MAAIAIDTLKFARRLIEVGVPEKQAEMQAELMAEAFVYNMDSLVPRDYLDARFAEQEVLIDARFNELQALFVAQKASNDISFVQIKGQFTLHNWILGAIAASTVLPTVHSLLIA
jgi:hypothetical protein